MKLLETTTNTFAVLTALHKVLGDTFPCSWEAYRETMMLTYDLKGDILDAMARLGHFNTTDSSVQFLNATT